jgi:hypothetical protein
MASQDPSTAYTAAPEKKTGSWFSSFSLPKLPNFFGSTTPAPTSAAAAASAPPPAVAEDSSSSQTAAGRRRRKMTKRAGRRTRRGSKKGGLTPMEDIKLTDADIRYVTTGPKYDFPPTQVRKGKGGRRTRRAKKHSRK